MSKGDLGVTNSVRDAELNVARCFADACARQHDAEIMVEGADLSRADMKDALLP